MHTHHIQRCPGSREKTNRNRTLQKEKKVPHLCQGTSCSYVTCQDSESAPIPESTSRKYCWTRMGCSLCWENMQTTFCNIFDLVVFLSVIAFRPFNHTTPSAKTGPTPGCVTLKSWCPVRIFPSPLAAAFYVSVELYLQGDRTKLSWLWKAWKNIAGRE